MKEYKVYWTEQHFNLFCDGLKVLSSETDLATSGLIW
jgi:hypothetical protein